MIDDVFLKVNNFKLDSDEQLLKLINNYANGSVEIHSFDYDKIYFSYDSGSLSADLSIAKYCSYIFSDDNDINPNIKAKAQNDFIKKIYLEARGFDTTKLRKSHKLII